MLSRHSGFIAVPDIAVVRRHDLNTGFIKRILYMLVEKRIDNLLLVGNLRIRIDLVCNIKIIQTFLEYKWHRMFFYHIRCQRGFDQQLVDLSPGCIISNGDRCMQDQTMLRCICTEIRSSDWTSPWSWESRQFRF